VSGFLLSVLLEELAAACARHQDVFGRLHIWINNAGVLSTKPFYEDEDWRKMIDVNLTAVIDGTSKAVCTPLSLTLLFDFFFSSSIIFCLQEYSVQPIFL